MATFDSYPERIKQACDRLDKTGAATLVKDLVKQIRRDRVPYPAERAIAALTPLRRKRYFDLALELADVAIESGQTSPKVRQFYLQALVDSKLLDAAVSYAKDLVCACEKGEPRDLREARGVLGRAYKQLYVNGAGDADTRAKYLRDAFDAYYGVYSDPKMTGTDWHAVNALALMARAKNDGVELPAVPPFAEKFNESMRAKVDADPDDFWAPVTAGEAALAIGDYDAAIRYYSQYAQGDPDKIDAFEIFSSLRQLEEVWQLTDTKPPGSDILPILRGALLKRVGGAIRVDAQNLGNERAAAKRAEGTEKMFGGRVRSATWYRKGLECCKAVCRIRTTSGHLGTGFLVRGSDFHEKLGDELLVLTNDHVISDTHPDAKKASEVYALFEALSVNKKYEFHPKIVWSDPSVDAALVRFRDAVPAKAKPHVIAGTCPALTEGAKPPRIYVIGHPYGWELSFSLQDNDLVASDGERLHYMSPTEQGSSGSPIFDDDWSLVGLHRRGKENIEPIAGIQKPYNANEGFWIGRIRERCSRSRKVR